MLRQLAIQLNALAPDVLRVTLGQEYAWNTKFVGEGNKGALGYPGPFRQSMALLSNSLRSEALQGVADSALLLCPNGVHGVGNDRNMLMLNPGLVADADMSVFRALGQLFGVAIRTNTNLALDVHSFVWKCIRAGGTCAPFVQLTHEEQLRELSAFDQHAANALRFEHPTTRKPYSEEEFARLHDTLTWTCLLSDERTRVELFPGGRDRRVRFAERHRYAELVLRARFEESARQLRALCDGFELVIPLVTTVAVQWVTADELGWRVCGRPTIDLAALKQHTRYVGLTEQQISDFWAVLNGFSEFDRVRFVQFGWARSRLPVDWGNLGMNLRAPRRNDAVLPSAETCFFNVYLPAYQSVDALREKLLLGITSTEIFH